MKKQDVELLDITVSVNKLKFGEIKRIIKEVISLDLNVDNLSTNEITELMIDKTDDLSTIANIIINFPKGTSLDDLYPDDFTPLLDKVMEVNNGFLELGKMLLNAPPQNAPQKLKSSTKV